MENTIDSITTTNTKTPLLPQVFPRNSAEQFEQACERMIGLAMLAQSHRALQELHSHFSTGAREGMDEYIFALDKQFAQGFIKSFPSVEWVTDELLQGGFDAISAAKGDDESAG